MSTVHIGGAWLAAAAWGALLVPADPDPELADDMYQWWVNGGKTHISALTEDFKVMSEVGYAADIDGMHDSCEQLAEDISAARLYDPMPDPVAQDYWSAALKDYALGAADCVEGTEELDLDLIDRSTQEIDEGNHEMDKATARVEEIFAGG